MFLDFEPPFELKFSTKLKKAFYYKSPQIVAVGYKFLDRLSFRSFD